MRPSARDERRERLDRVAKLVCALEAMDLLAQRLAFVEVALLQRSRVHALGGATSRLPADHHSGLLHVEPERLVERERAHVERVLQETDAGRSFAALHHGLHQQTAVCGDSTGGHALVTGNRGGGVGGTGSGRARRGRGRRPRGGNATRAASGLRQSRRDVRPARGLHRHRGRGEGGAQLRRSPMASSRSATPTARATASRRRSPCAAARSSRSRSPAPTVTGPASASTAAALPTGGCSPLPPPGAALGGSVRAALVLVGRRLRRQAARLRSRRGPRAGQAAHPPGDAVVRHARRLQLTLRAAPQRH